MSENVKDWMAIAILGSVFGGFILGCVYIFYLAAGWWGLLIFAGIAAFAWAACRVSRHSTPYRAYRSPGETK